MSRNTAQGSSGNVHILFFTENFPPECNAPAVRTHAHCREWVEAGHKVTIITCAPNFPQGAVHPGYKNALRSVEEVDGIEVIRVWSYIAANKGFVRRILDQLSYMICAAIAAFMVKRVDVVIGTSPQFFALCAARFVAKIKGVPFIAEIRDLWPASIKAVGALSDGFVYRQLVKLESYLYQRADHIVVVTQAQKDHLVHRGIEEAKVSVVINGADTSILYPRPRDVRLQTEHGLQDNFVVGYIGTIGMAHALETVLEAARHQALNNGGARFHFLFVGSGAYKERLKQHAQRLGLTNVTFVGMQPQYRIADFYSLLDVAVVHLRDTPEFRKVLPSKLFECMAMGIPVLHGVNGYSADFVSEAKAGVIFESENVVGLAESLTELAQDDNRLQQLGANGLKAARRFDRKQLARRMLTTVERCVDQNRVGESEPRGIV